MIDQAGKYIAKYKVIRKIGQGGMADVYLALDPHLEREVAIKIIRTEMFPPIELERVLKRFEHEAKSLAKMDHPNIIHILDYGEFEGKPFLVMPYFDDDSLKNKVKRAIPWQIAFKLMLPIIDAVAYAHSQNIIHRDIKPSNILLRKNNSPVITDFGVAKILSNTDNSTSLTMAGVGTPNYMAPEQWDGKTVFASDQYSIGVVLYELITGNLPYSADTPAAVMIRSARDPLPPPSSFIPELPNDVEKILVKLLEKDPNHRYKDVLTLGKLVRSLLQQNTLADEELVQTAEIVLDPTNDLTTDGVKKVLPLKGTLRKTISSFFRHHKALVFGLSAILFLSGFFLIYLALPNKNTSANDNIDLSVSTTEEKQIQEDDSDPIIKQQLIEEDPYAGPVPDGALFRIGKGIITGLRYIPNSKKLLISSTTGAWIFDPKANPKLSLLFEAGNINTLASDSNGSKFAFGTSDGRIILWDQVHQRKINTVQGYEEIEYNDDVLVMSMAFTHDDKMVVSQSAQGIIKVWALPNLILQTTINFDDFYGFIPTLTSRTFSISKNDEQIAALNALGVIFFDLKTGTTVKQSPPISNLTGSLYSYSNDKNFLIQNTFKNATILDVESNTIISTYDVILVSANAFAFSEETSMIAQNAEENAIVLSDANTGAWKKTLFGGRITPWFMEFSSDGQQLASWSGDLLIWDIETGTIIETIEGFGVGSGSNIVFSNDGEFLARAGSAKGSIGIWDPDTGDLIQKLEEREKSLFGWQNYSINFSPDATKLIGGRVEYNSNNSTGRTTIWDINNGIEVESTGYPGVVNDVAYSPDGIFYAVATGKTVLIKGTQTGSTLITLTTSGGKYDEVVNIKFSPNANLIAIGGRESNVTIFKVNFGEILFTLEDCRGYDEFDFSPDSSRIICGTTIYDAETGNLIGEFRPNGKRIGCYSPLYSPDGNALACSQDQALTIYDLKTNSIIKQFGSDSSSYSYYEYAFSPDGRSIAVDLGEGTITMWNLYE